MRIKGLSIDGFGLFHDSEIRELSPGLNLVLGHNEAGKSTVMGFVHAILFGFADGRSKEPSYPPLRGGQHGGRLLLETDDLGAFTIERGPGPRGGSLKIQTEHGDLLSNVDRERALGGVNDKLYRTLYGFSLSELQSFESIASEDVRDVIYGASLGTGLRALPQARKKLITHAEYLFKKGGQKPEINQRLQALEENRDKLRDAKGGLRRFEEISSEIEALDHRIDEETESLLKLRAHAERTRALLRAWADWQALRDARHELDDLEPRVEEFPEEGLEQLTEVERQLDVERKELAHALRSREQQHDRLKQLVHDTTLAEHGAEVAELLQGIDAINKAKLDLPRARDQFAKKSDHAGEVLIQLGTNWHEERALALDRSPHTHETIGAHHKQLKQQEDDLQARKRSLRDAETAAEKAKDACKSLEDQIASDDLGDLNLDSALIQQLRDGRETFTRVVRDLPRQNSERQEIMKSFQATLREIDPSWTAETLDGLDISLQAQRKIEEADKAENKSIESKRAAIERQKRTTEALSKVSKQLETASSELAQIEGTTSDSTDVDAIKKLRMEALNLRSEASRLFGEQIELKALLERQIEAQNMSDRQTSAGLGSKLLAVAGVVGPVGLGGAAVLFFNGQEVGAAAVGVGAVTITALLLWLRAAVTSSATIDPGATTKLREPITKLQHRIDERKGNIEAGLVKLELDPTLASDDKVDLVVLFQERADKLAEFIPLAERVAELTAEQQDVQGKMDAAEAEVTATEEAAAQLRESWRAHANSLSLPEDISPRTATLVFGKAEKAQTDLDRIRAIDRSIKDLEASRQGLLKALKQIPSLAALLDRDDNIVRDGLIKFLSDVDQNETRLRNRERLQNRLADAREEAARTEDRLTKEHEAHKQAITKLEKEQAAWRSWLEAADMDPDWSPETAKNALDRTERLFELIRDRDEQATRAKELTAQIEHYHERASSLFSKLGRALPSEDELMLQINQLAIEREDNEAQRSRYAELRASIEAADAQIGERKQWIGDLERDLKALLEKASCSNVDEMRARGKAYERRLELESDIEKHTRDIRRTTDAETLAVVEPELAKTSKDQLLAMSNDLDRKIESVEAERDKLQNQRGELGQARTALSSENRISELRAEEESLREELDQLAQDWARHSIAEHLLDVAKERHAQANQPKVIQEASRYFELITGGRYTRVFAPPGEGKIEVSDAQGRTKDSTDLSRGSAEQLYLAIRFGYIAAQAAGTEPLPVLMDDVLVNFDPQRASAAARSIVELSQGRQVLFFTCHPATIEIFREYAEDAPLYRIDDGELIPANQGG